MRRVQLSVGGWSEMALAGVQGGARRRSGPRPDPGSGRSERRGYKLTALPAEGYDGPVPGFPLPNPLPRELEVWQEVWRTPQACVWSMTLESWRLHTIAMYVRVKVRCEAPDAGPSLLAQLHRFADQIGMTTAGLADMGWRIATEPTPSQPAIDNPSRSSTGDFEDKPHRRRLRAVTDQKGDTANE